MFMLTTKSLLFLGNFSSIMFSSSHCIKSKWEDSLKMFCLLILNVKEKGRSVYTGENFSLVTYAWKRSSNLMKYEVSEA